MMADPARLSPNTAVATPAPASEEAPELESEPVTASTLEAPAPSTTRVRDRALAGDRWIARVLRVGAVLSGGMFVLSLGLEALPGSESTHVAIDQLRKAAASLLLVTPVARLGVAGTLLGLRGEWRYAVIAAGVLGLLALAVGAGIQA
ncbi:hypothetical protein MFU01_32840 [Myxococcus fulvus]|uniref:DUF1634 domain-containing protein n=2 Tax=Myxococcus fulvus TaxID=33 RepID=A0A511T2X8_MYXFU|nr:hypothetical protein [Myxococcus fulvus]AKF82689.1 hypothetical protein MFUL124B02_29740 [Myxococcus fulvus 124B02]GEN08247.1 hypothetical protein MFU01_32840 [Myxococcus fulvus]